MTRGRVVHPLALGPLVAVLLVAGGVRPATGQGAAAPPDSHVRLASQTAWVGPADQYAVLCATNPLQRLDVIDALLDGVEEGLRFRLG